MAIGVGMAMGSPFSSNSYDHLGRIIEAHPWLIEQGGLQAHTRIMRGEEALPHSPDGSCLQCAKVYKEQLALLKRKGILPYKMLIGGPYPSLREMVRRSLRRLASW